MAGKFRRRAGLVIEAFQMTKERRWDNSEWPVWLHEAWQKDSDELGSLWCFTKKPPRPDVNESIFICTVEGDIRVNWGDWILFDGSPVLTLVADSAFEICYEKVGGL